MDGKLRRIVLCLVLTLVMTLGISTPGLMEQVEFEFDEPTYTSDTPDTSYHESDSGKSSDSESEHDDRSEVSVPEPERSRHSEDAHHSHNIHKSSSSYAEAHSTLQQQLTLASDFPSMEHYAEGDEPHHRKPVEKKDAAQRESIVWEDAPQGTQTAGAEAEQQAQPSTSEADTSQQAQNAATIAEQQAQEPIVWESAPQQETTPEDEATQQTQETTPEGEAVQQPQGTTVWSDESQQEPTAGDDTAQQAQETTPEGEAAQQAQEATPEGEAAQQAQEATPEGEAAQQAQETTPEGEAAQQAQETTPEGEAAQQAQETIPEGEAAQQPQETTPEGEAAQQDALDENDIPQGDVEVTAEEMTVVSESEEAVSKEAVLSLLDQFLSRDPKVYDNELALVAAKLSQKAYDKTEIQEYLKKDLGFAPENITTYNYGFLRSYCFAIATMPYAGEGAQPNSKILVLAIRGSATINELIQDSLSYSYKKRLGYDVIGVVETFYEKIAPQLPDFKSDDTDYRILVTGHSLGGATANLTAAELNNAGQKNVFCYTFGAINSIKSDKPVTKGYENIHNIYNDLDTFSPLQYGWIMRNGAGTKYGKFGHLDAYVYDHRTKKQKGRIAPIQIVSAVNHSMDNYVQDVAAGRTSCKVDEEVVIPEKPRKQTWSEWFREIKEKVRSKFRRNKKTTANAGQPSALYNDAQLTNKGVVFMASDNPAITDDIVKESFTDFLKTYTMITGDKVTYSAGKNVLGDGTIEILSIDVMKEKDRDHLVMIDVLNRSSQSVSLTLSQLQLNGMALDCGDFHSDLIPAGEHTVITIKTEALLALSGQSDTQIGIDDTLSFVMGVNSALGEKIYALDVISVPLEPAE